MITPNLVSWQWQHYPEAHSDRRNLLIHIVTEPLFLCGVILAPSAFGLGHAAIGASGVGLLVIAVIAQGRGHKLEKNAPLPFRSPLDVVARLFVEQLVNFPRFVLSGGFGRAWRDAGSRRD